MATELTLNIMKARSRLIIIVGFVMASCVSKENRLSQNDGISGAYAREYSFKVVNPEGGNEIGYATIRDTVFIQQAEKGFRVENHKWRLNDYTKDGWQNMEHSDDRPVPNYEATFQLSDSALVEQSVPNLYLNGQCSALYKGTKGKNPYQRVK